MRVQTALAYKCIAILENRSTLLRLCVTASQFTFTVLFCQILFSLVHFGFAFMDSLGQIHPSKVHPSSVQFFSIGLISPTWQVVLRYRVTIAEKSSHLTCSDGEQMEKSGGLHWCPSDFTTGESEVTDVMVNIGDISFFNTTQ